MITWIKNLISKKYVGSVVRHLLTALSGVFATLGLTDIGEQFTSIIPQLIDIIVAVIMYGLAQVWSIKEKKLPKA